MVKIGCSNFLCFSTFKKALIFGLYFPLIFACTSNQTFTKKVKTSATLLERKFDKEIKQQQNNSLESRLQFLTDFANKAEEESSAKVLFLVNFEKGNLHYSLLNNDSALFYWQKALAFAERKHDLENLASLNNNLGTYYLQNGYTETAIHYFLLARKSKEKLKVFDQNYWSIHLNIGVANMTLNQYARAANYFNSIPINRFKNLKFLVYLNKAKLAALQKNQEGFYYNMGIAKQFLDLNSYYINIFDEVFLEVSIEFRDIKNLTPISKKLVSSYSQQPLYMKILLNQAAILISGKTINNENVTKVFKTELAKERNSYTCLAYNTLLIDYYKAQKNYKLQAFFLEKGNSLVDKINNKEAKIALNDYFTIQTKNKLSFENEQLKTANELKTLKIKNQKYFTIFLILAILGMLLLGWYLISSYKKKQLEKEKDVTNMQLNLGQQITERQRLQKLVLNQEFKIKEILMNVSKIAILKKQMEGFIASISELNSSETEKDLAKLAKVNTNAFFNNYIDLAILASQKDDNDFAEIKSKYQLILTENEMNVLLLILNDYTTKEIAILLSKSEKGIEYSRKNIRMKLNVPKEKAINQFVLDDLN